MVGAGILAIGILSRHCVRKKKKTEVDSSIVKEAAIKLSYCTIRFSDSKTTQTCQTFEHALKEIESRGSTKVKVNLFASAIFLKNLGEVGTDCHIDLQDVSLEKATAELKEFISNPTLYIH